MVLCCKRHHEPFYPGHRARRRRGSRPRPALSRLRPRRPSKFVVFVRTAPVGSDEVAVTRGDGRLDDREHRQPRRRRSIWSPGIFKFATTLTGSRSS